MRKLTDTTPTYFVDAAVTNNHFYFYSPIGDAENYIEFVHTLDNAQEGERVHLHLCTPGGDVEGALVIIHALLRTKAHVIGYAEGGVASAGTMILLCCHEYIVMPYAHFLFHDGSIFGGGGKFNENLKMMKATSELYAKLAYSIYVPYLEETEVDQILEGIDKYMSSEEMLERMERSALSNDQAEDEIEEG